MLMLKIMKNMQKSEYDLRLRISNPYMKIMPQHLPCMIIYVQTRLKSLLFKDKKRPTFAQKVAQLRSKNGSLTV